MPAIYKLTEHAKISNFTANPDLKFHPFTYRFKLSNKQHTIKWYYKAIANGCKCLCFNETTRELYIKDWDEALGVWMHKNPRCRYTDPSDVYDILYDLIKLNLVERKSPRFREI